MLTFIKTVAVSYKEDRRAVQFIPDLLQLDVPRLFSSEPHRGAELSGVGEAFVEFLKEYIRRNNLSAPLIREIQVLLTKAPDNQQHGFQLLIFSVLKSVSSPCNYHTYHC